MCIRDRDGVRHLGKIGVPDAILNKRDRLSDEEYAVIKTHPQQGGGGGGAEPTRH